jgi:uncharacterized protein YbjT (DUF2867 family)
MAALETRESAGHVIEIGGKDILTYGNTMAIYAKVRGLRRLMLPASKGLFGLAYWVFLYPIYRLVFSRMFQRLVRVAEATPQPA